jgi:hypothetical protein
MVDKRGAGRTVVRNTFHNEQAQEAFKSRLLNLVLILLIPCAF